MSTFMIVIIVIGIFIVVPTLTILLVAKAIKKEPLKPILKGYGVTFAIVFVAFVIGLITVPDDVATETPTTEKVKTTAKIQETTTEILTTEQHIHNYVEVESTPNISLREMIVKTQCSCGKTKTENVKMTTLELASYLKEKCQTYTYEEIARKPDIYKGELAVFTGEVIQVQEIFGITTLLVNITKEGNEYYSYYTDAVYVNYNYADELKLLDGDIITMYGELQGEQKYLTVLGQYVSVPLVDIYYAELN